MSASSRQALLHVLLELYRAQARFEIIHYIIFHFSTCMSLQGSTAIPNHMYGYIPGVFVAGYQTPEYQNDPTVPTTPPNGNTYGSSAPVPQARNDYYNGGGSSLGQPTYQLSMADELC